MKNHDFMEMDTKAILKSLNNARKKKRGELVSVDTDIHIFRVQDEKSKNFNVTVEAPYGQGIVALAIKNEFSEAEVLRIFIREGITARAEKGSLK